MVNPLMEGLNFNNIICLTFQNKKKPPLDTIKDSRAFHSILRALTENFKIMINVI